MTRSTFALPILIALASFAGLMIALTGDGWRDAVGWAGLSTTLLAIGWALRRAASIRKDRS